MSLLAAPGLGAACCSGMSVALVSGLLPDATDLGGQLSHAVARLADLDRRPAERLRRRAERALGVVVRWPVQVRQGDAGHREAPALAADEGERHALALSAPVAGNRDGARGRGDRRGAGDRRTGHALRRARRILGGPIGRLLALVGLTGGPPRRPATGSRAGRR